MRLLHTLRQDRFPLLTLGSLWILLVGGGVGAVINENAAKASLARDAEAQVELLASAVAGALAFDDRAAAQDYVEAVQVNPGVLAAAVYDDQNRLVASFARPGEAIPPVATPRGRTTAFRDGRLYVVRPVEQAGQYLGTVRMRLNDLSPSQRLGRYIGLALVLAMAGLVVAVLGVAQNALRRANRELADRADDLARANAGLEQEMIEREKVEDALRQSQKMEAIGRLTGGIAHDFNNLLMVASSGIELLDRTEDPRRRRKLSDGVRQAIDRGAGLTRQLLAFSRQAPLRGEVIDPAAQIEGLRILLERSLREDIEVDLRLPNDLWPVEVDVGEFELALLNLAVNARDAMPQGGRLVIDGRNDPADPGKEDSHDTVVLEVSDTGTGIPADIVAHVFEPFFTTKEVGKGTGLGLSQVYGFARSSGGDIAVRSSQGAGTTFVICLPRSNKPLSAPRGTPDPSVVKADGRILLVEDDDAVADAVGHMLIDLGYSFVRAANGPAALSILDAGERFDLVLSDMIMPGDMDGLQLSLRVRAALPDQPVLLTTGFSEAAASAQASGFKLLAKPYGIELLAEAIADARAEPAEDGQ